MQTPLELADTISEEKYNKSLPRNKKQRRKRLKNWMQQTPHLSFKSKAIIMPQVWKKHATYELQTGAIDPCQMAAAVAATKPQRQKQ